MAWKIEEIPDEDLLYRRVHRNLVAFSEPAYSVIFKVSPPGMSTDWSKFSTPTETRNRALSSNPEDKGVISLQTGEVRAVDSLSVNYTPTKENKAHTTVIGEKTPEVVVKLSRIYSWEIKPPNIS